MLLRSCVCLFFLAGFLPATGQSVADLPTLTEKNGRHELLVDGKPFFLLGGQAHNSSSWPATLPQVWSAMESLHANALETPVYWEQVEPEQGRFDFSLVDTLLAQARIHGVRLVLLWFATWKNGSNHYMPGWMKAHAGLYPNCTGKDGKPVDSPSPVAEATLEADKAAFTAFMRHLKAADRNHTVILVQVENEPGSWGTVRDYSAAAQRLFQGPVPVALLKPELLKALGHPGATGGNWTEVFGADADEYFHAWSVASFIGRVAAAGKKEYPLPLYCNAALRDPVTHPSAAYYESGGPTDNVIPIWKAAAPAIDLVGPDIYLPKTEKVLKVIDLYTRADNPLFVPESALSPDNAKYLFAVLAHGGIGYACFGIDGHDDPGRLAPFAAAYRLFVPVSMHLAEWAYEGRISAAVEPDDHGLQSVEVPGWLATVTFGTGRGGQMQPNLRPTGAALIIHQKKNVFLATGTLCRISFRPAGADSGKAWQYLKVEEGGMVNGIFVPRRILNGDETDWGGPAFGPDPVWLRISLITR